MAGTLQTLNLKPPKPHNLLLHPTKNHQSLPNLPHFPSNPIFSHRPLSLHPNFPTISQPIRSTKVGGGGGGDDDENGHNRTSNSSSNALAWAQPVLRFAESNFLPLALVSGVALGLANPSLGCLAHRCSLSKFSTFGIFLISGLVLRSEEIGAAAEAWPAGLFGLVSILLLSPIFSRLILQLRLTPQEFVTGIAIFSCMPTTLSSGVTLTQLVGGNSALALAMTVISNLLGILTVPFSISKYIADGVGVTVPIGELFTSLIITLLVPLILGKVFRDHFNGVAELVDQNRKILSMISAILLSLVPWIQVSSSRSLLLIVKPTVFLTAIGMGMILHLVLLAFNSLAALSFSVASGGEKSVFAKKENMRALILVASQKTLPVMVAVVEQLHGALGVSGLLVLPCVAAHINQIVFDSVLVSLWLRKDQQLRSMKSVKPSET